MHLKLVHFMLALPTLFNFGRSEILSVGRRVRGRTGCYCCSKQIERATAKTRRFKITAVFAILLSVYFTPPSTNLFVAGLLLNVYSNGQYAVLCFIQSFHQCVCTLGTCSCFDVTKTVLEAAQWPRLTSQNLTIALAVHDVVSIMNCEWTSVWSRLLLP